MKVAYICNDPGIPVFGEKGCSIHVQEIINCFLEEKYSVELYSSRLCENIPDRFKDLTIKHINVGKHQSSSAREKAYLNSNKQLTALLNNSDNIELVYERYSLWSYAAIDFANENNIPCILEVNSPLIEEQEKHRELHNKEKAIDIAQHVFNKASLLVAVSEEIAEYLKKYTNNEKIIVAPNGVDASRFKVTDRPVTDDSSFTVGFIGTLKPWHGVDQLIDAFQHLFAIAPDARLLIVGDGPEKENLQNKVARIGLSHNTTFTGKVKPEDVPYWLSKMDVGVAPYPKLENFYFSPLKVFEYLAAGLPVVASNLGQLNRIIRNNENGLLFEAGQTKDLIEKLILLHQNSSLRTRLGINGRNYVINNHSWKSTFNSIINKTNGSSDTPKIYAAPYGVK